MAEIKHGILNYEIILLLIITRTAENKYILAGTVEDDPNKKLLIKLPFQAKPSI